MEGKGARGPSSCSSNQMLELKLGCAVCCTPCGHSTEEAMFVPDPAGPHAEPWRHPGASSSQRGSGDPEGRDSATSLCLSSHPQSNLADEVPKTSFWIQTTFPFPQEVPLCPRPSSPTGESSRLPQAWLRPAAALDGDATPSPHRCRSFALPTLPGSCCGRCPSLRGTWGQGATSTPTPWHEVPLGGLRGYWRCLSPCQPGSTTGELCPLP